MRSLNEQLSNLNDEERKDLRIKGRINRVNIAKQNDDEAVISSTAYSKMVGGKCTHTECVMDSGCSFPLTSTAVVEALGIKVKPLKEKLEMLDASNRIVEIIGTARIFIDNEVLGGRKCVEAAVIESEKKETLICLGLLKKWDLLHDSFPYQTISDYVIQNLRNKSHKAYSTYYNFNPPQQNVQNYAKKLWNPTPMYLRKS